MNYFLFDFNENSDGNNNIGLIINLNTKKLIRKSDKLEISYPLYNYYNKNSLANKRNSENLLNNIKEINSHYPEIDLTNKTLSELYIPLSGEPEGLCYYRGVKWLNMYGSSKV